jgi:hypothetical protein
MAQVERRVIIYDEGADSLQSIGKQVSDKKTLMKAVVRPNGTMTLSERDEQGRITSIQVNVHLPTMVASVGYLSGMGAFEQRAIHIVLERASMEELDNLVEGWDCNNREFLHPLLPRLARWAMDNGAKFNAKMENDFRGVGKRLQGITFRDPRDRDKWTPPIALNDYLSPELGQEMRRIATEFMGDDPITAHDDSHGHFDQFRKIEATLKRRQAKHPNLKHITHSELIAQMHGVHPDEVSSRNKQLLKQALMLAKVNPRGMYYPKYKKTKSCYLVEDLLNACAKYKHLDEIDEVLDDELRDEAAGVTAVTAKTANTADSSDSSDTAEAEQSADETDDSYDSTTEDLFDDNTPEEQEQIEQFLTT